MSGPKVVNLEAVKRRRQRESLVRISQLRDLLREWRAAMQQAGLLTDAMIAEADAMIPRLDNLRETEQWEQLFKELPARQAFFRDATTNAEQTTISHRASVRERRRRLEVGIAMLRRELRAVGKDCPPELQVGSANENADEKEISSLEALLQNTFKNLPGQEPEPAATAQQRELAKTLQDQSTRLVKFEDWLLARTGETADTRTKNDRLTRALAELEVLAPAESAAPLFEKARIIVAEISADRRVMLTDSLLIEADELCRSVREMKDAKRKLLESISAIEPFRSQEADAWRLRLRSALENPSPKAIVELVNAAQNWCEAEAAREEATLRREAVLKALAALGYEVREGMATAWAENGRVILRKPAEPNYGVEIASAPTGAAVQARVVAFGPADRPQSMQRDREVELSWCSDFQEMRELMEAEGLTPTLLQAKAPGEIPIKVVPPIERDKRGSRPAPALPRSREFT